MDCREYGGLVLGFEWVVGYTEDWYCAYLGLSVDCMADWYQICSGLSIWMTITGSIVNCRVYGGLVLGL